MESDGPVADRCARLGDRPGEDVGRDPDDVAARSLGEEVEAAGERFGHVPFGDDDELVRRLVREEAALSSARTGTSIGAGIAFPGEAVVDDAAGVERRTFDRVAAAVRGPQERERSEAADPSGLAERPTRVVEEVEHVDEEDGVKGTGAERQSERGGADEAVDSLRPGPDEHPPGDVRAHQFESPRGERERDPRRPDADLEESECPAGAQSRCDRVDRGGGRRLPGRIVGGRDDVERFRDLARAHRRPGERDGVFRPDAPRPGP